MKFYINYTLKETSKGTILWLKKEILMKRILGNMVNQQSK